MDNKRCVYRASISFIRSLYTYFNTIFCQYLILQIKCEGAGLMECFVVAVLSLSSLNILFIK